MKETYIANLKFNTVQKQVWFISEKNNEANDKWKLACKKLNEVGDKCSDASEFFDAAIEHFKAFGFIRIAK
jgi:hypothetical protein